MSGMAVTRAMRAHVELKGLVPANATDCQVKDAIFNALRNDTLSQEELDALVRDKAPTPTPEPANGGQPPGKGKGKMTTPNPLFGSARVKSSSEAYTTTKRAAVHTKTGKPVQWMGKQVEAPSALELAKFGALMKLFAMKGGQAVVLTEHERGLIQDCIEKDAWNGSVNGIEYEKASPEMVKSLIYDSTSGGQYLSPYFVDEMFVQLPLLHSELLPRVTTVEVPRGTTVFGGSLGNPTVVWNTAEGTGQTEFDTTGLAAQLNTTIHPVMVWLTMGRDWLSDVPGDAGAMLVENIGGVMLKELDRVIAVGDGTNEPEGIFTASGTTAVPSDMSTSGPPTVGDYEGLMFSTGKVYRNAGLEPCFFGNDTSYRRARGIAVGPMDERRVFGMDESSYQLLDHPYLVQNDIANSKIGFGAMKKYRLYRRLGSQVTFVSGTDATLMSKNLDGLFVRARYGGRVMDANAFAVMTDGQS